jgi:ATP-dependent exoDNAse (exonuclease V) beta subunit
LPELVRAVLDRTRLVEFAMLQPHGDQIAANLLKVIDQARTFAEASGRGLRGFVCWLKQNIDRASDEADASISEETDDVVRILTIHSAKGLEFPIVVFANMATTRRDDTTVIADRDAHRLHVKLGAREHGFRTPGYDEAEASEQAHTLAEERRLLYVAATRARDHLIVSLIDKVDGAPRKGVKSLNDWLRVAGADTGECIEAASLAPPQREVPLWKRPIELHSTADIARVLDERAAWIAERKKLIERASRQAQIHTASSLKQEIDETSRYAFDAIRRGPAAGFGAAVHALLERSALRFDHIDALAAAVACEFGMHARSDEMAAIARRALSSDAVRRANAARRVLLETPFTVRLAAGSLAEGRIDLLFEEDGGLVIVDFKTDAVSAREVEERAAIYRNQALTYAWASSHAAGIQAREVIFLFARPEPAIEHHLLVDDTFMVEAESLLSREPTLVS